MGNKLIGLKDLDDLLCKYEVEDLEDLENRFIKAAEKKEQSIKFTYPEPLSIEEFKRTLNNAPCVVLGIDTNEPSINQEKTHLLDEKEWQDYCAYKIIEPQIKGCLDRERTYLNFFENFETNVNLIIAHNSRADKCEIVKEIIYFVNQQIKKLRGE